MPALAQQQDCSEEIAEIDRRIATGRYPETNVQVARTVKTALAQMCALMDDASRANMMEQVEDLLPTKTEEERRAERRVKAAQAKAAREERRRERAAAEAAAVQEPLFQAAPTARTAFGRLVPRPDPMYHVWLMDWDTHGDKLRVLYIAFPDRTQFGLPDWTSTIYVVEVAPDGATTQHAVTQEQTTFNYGGLALRRGADEVLLHRRSGKYRDVGTLERWSIDTGRQLASAAAPDPEWIDGSVQDWGPFRAVTREGNLLYAAVNEGRRRALAWFEAAPDGRVVARGALSDERHDYGAPHWFSSSHGGGMALEVVNFRESGVASAVATPIRREIGGRTLQAVVSREVRLLVPAGNADSAWTSAAIERDLMWGGEQAIPSDLPVEERTSQMNAQRELMDAVAVEHGAGYDTLIWPDSPHSRKMIVPMGADYVALSRRAIDADRFPRVAGQALLKIDRSGVRVHAHLEPWAQRLGARFTLLGATDSGLAYLTGFPRGRDADAYVVQLDAEGRPKAFGPIAESGSVTLQGLEGDATGTWVIGFAYPRKQIANVWIGRVEFP